MQWKFLDRRFLQIAFESGASRGCVRSKTDQLEIVCWPINHDLVRSFWNKLVFNWSYGFSYPIEKSKMIPITYQQGANNLFLQVRCFDALPQIISLSNYLIRFFSQWSNLPERSTLSSVDYGLFVHWLIILWFPLVQRQALTWSFRYDHSNNFMGVSSSYGSIFIEMHQKFSSYYFFS